MDNLMILDEKAKQRIGIICFIPLAAYFVCFIYYTILLLPLTDGHHSPGEAVGIINRNYDTLFAMLAVASVITAPIFIYCLVLLARFKHINAAEKVLWIVFLSIMAPVASALFWLLIIRTARRQIPIHPDIA